MAWLASVAALLLEKLLALLGQDIINYIEKRKIIAQAQAAALAEAKASVQPLKDAKTGEAVDKATDSALDRT